jgi:hypothetical protein
MSLLYDYCKFQCLQALMESHDAVAFKTYESPPPSPGIENFNGYGGGEPIRMVGLHKQANEHLVSKMLLFPGLNVIYVS